MINILDNFINLKKQEERSLDLELMLEKVKKTNNLKSEKSFEVNNTEHLDISSSKETSKLSLHMLFSTSKIIKKTKKKIDKAASKLALEPEEIKKIKKSNKKNIFKTNLEPIGKKHQYNLFAIEEGTRNFAKREIIPKYTKMKIIRKSIIIENVVEERYENLFRNNNEINASSKNPDKKGDDQTQKISNKEKSLFGSPRVYLILLEY